MNLNLLPAVNLSSLFLIATSSLFAFGSLCQPTAAAETDANLWRYTFDKPADGWMQADFDDSGWRDGVGGFGTDGTPNARINTNWDTSDIWIRRTVQLREVPADPALLIHHDEDCQVYINGTEVAALSGWSTDYQIHRIAQEDQSAVLEGPNILAAHCHQTSGGQCIDIYLGDANNPPRLTPIELVKSDLITRWGRQVSAENAWTQYPRPQLQRDQWTNLNGEWDYAIGMLDQDKIPTDWDGKILVPFCLESKLGGVGRALEPDESLWYHREFEVQTLAGKRTLLNFEAVDYECEVFVGGKSVGQHRGGNSPFSIDISDAIVDGGNDLVLKVVDATEGSQLRGKQVLNAGGIFYTRVSGIWQTVWLEQVGDAFISDLKIQSDAAAGTITVTPELGGQSNSTLSMNIVVRDGESLVAQSSVTLARDNLKSTTLTIPSPRLWSPPSPTLYSIELELVGKDGIISDRIESYAGIRTVGKTTDADGHLRMTLNGEVIFHWGPLDQGWWPDGLLTPPSDAAMSYDIEWLKSAGFNMIRKHIKVEPRRYYYHCDRLGMLVWQDQVSGGLNPKWTFLDRNPNDADWSDANHEQFMLEFERMVDDLENHPSIVVWTPFNEAWGQHRTVEVGRWISQRDPSRLVNIASGGNFWPIGDIVDRHNYPSPAFPFDPDRFGDFVKVVGEFGGHGYAVQGHLWDASKGNWGYGGLPKNEQEYRERDENTIRELAELRRQGIAAGVYTQTTDVESEINGLMTYDREQIKIPAEELNRIHRQLFED